MKFFFSSCSPFQVTQPSNLGKMDYDDDDDQYRQYEDEMYKDASEEG